MKRLILFYSVLMLFLFVIPSCKKDGAVPNMGYNYFPDQVGKYVVYDVDSIYYNDFTVPLTIDTFQFQIKEKIQSLYYDNQNRATLRLERYTRLYDTLPWILKDVWAENKSLTAAEKVEENVRFVKLVFPVKDNQAWNGNAQNTIGEENYTYTFFDQAKYIGSQHFDSTLQVTQHDETNLILKKYFVEKYVRNIGLAYKQTIDVQSQPNPSWSNTTLFPFGSDSINLFFSEPNIMKRVTSGYEFTYVINSFGTE